MRNLIAGLFFFLTLGATARPSEAERALLRAGLNLRNPDSVHYYLDSIDRTRLTDTLWVEYWRIRGTACVYAGNADSAVMQLSRAASRVSEEECDRQSFQVSNALAAALQTRGLYAEALPHYLTALSCAELLNDTIGQAKVLNNLSIISREVYQFNEALEFARRSEQLYRLTDESSLHAGALNSLAQVYMADRKFQEALMYFHEALVRWKAADDLRGMGLAFNNIGSVHQLLEDHGLALTYLDSAFALRTQLNDVPGQASVRINQAEAYMQLGDLAKSESLLDEASGIGAERLNGEFQRRILSVRMYIAKARKDWETAFKLSEQILALKEELRVDAKADESARILFARDLLNTREVLNKARFDQAMDRERLQRQRLVNLFLSIGISVVLGLLALLVYLLRMSSALRRQLMEERDLVKKQSGYRKAALDQVAHEIRTPLQGILTMNQLLSRERNEEEAKELMALLVNSAQRLLDSVNYLLDFSRVEEGRMEPNRSLFNPYEIINDVVSELKPQADAKGLHLSTHWTPENRAEMHSDQVLFSQIIINLVANAVKYTEKGGVDIRIAQLGQYLEVRVEDSGIGIPKAVRERIFEPFYRVGNSRELGTGLGLSLAKRYTEVMGGTLEMESEVGVGTTFILKLPLSV